MVGIEMTTRAKLIEWTLRIVLFLVFVGALWGVLWLVQQLLILLLRQWP